MFKDSQIRNCIGWAIIPMWAATLCVVVSSLMVGHWVTLPHPDSGSTMQVSDGIVTSAGGYRTYHFLYGNCPCSRRVLKQVLTRCPIEGANERIVLVGSDREFEEKALLQGFELDVVTPVRLKDTYGVESAPLLVITKDDGTICYSGGYTSRKQGLDFQDVEIVSRTISGSMVEGLPVFGCAVSSELKAIIDPLNLKY